MKISLFKNAFSDTPTATITIKELVDGVRDGKWQKTILNLRSLTGPAYKKAKGALPCVTVSGDFVTRNKHKTLDERLRKHTGYICLDVDAKDNPKMRVKDLIDKDAFAEFISCSGGGKKIIYLCKPVKTAEEHRRIYDAAIKRLEEKGIRLKVDPIVKSIASLQYVSYDPDAYYNPKSKVVIQPLPAIKRKKVAPSEDKLKDLAQLKEYVEALGDTDITGTYENWMLVLFGISYSLGEAGRGVMHDICRNYKDYSELECDEKYDAFLERDPASIEKPVTLSTVFQILNDHLPKPVVKQLAKKYIPSHAVGEGTEITHGDLAGMVSFKLFLFKKVIDKDNVMVDLIPSKLNLNAFEKLLTGLNFFRYLGKFIQINANVIEEVDLDDIIRIITKHVEGDGDYVFTYQESSYTFSWEELVHLWRTTRAQGTTYNQITASLEHWKGEALKDTPNQSFIPYQNGVLTVSKSGTLLQSYETLPHPVWKERILNRDYNNVKGKGMFETFFENTTGRGDTMKKRIASESYLRSMWYYGYMLHSNKRESTARAWLLYDMQTGNNGRSGKTIIGKALGKIRSMVTLDGKQIDFKNRFAFQTVQPWTDIVFIDDPTKYMSLNPLFNMITGSLTADRKNLRPLEIEVKFLIASNWVLESQGKSESGRQFVTQLSNFYSDYSEKNGNTTTPLIDIHGKEFFSDWDKKDWAQFDNFAAKALQYYFSNRAPENTIIGNAKVLRFVQSNEEEMFIALASNLVEHSVVTDRGLSVVQSILVNVVKEMRDTISTNSAGRTVREFLAAIGCTAQSSSIRQGSMIKMVYNLGVKDFKQLDFGGFEDRIIKRK